MSKRHTYLAPLCMVERVEVESLLAASLTDHGDGTSGDSSVEPGTEFDDEFDVKANAWGHEW